jgi:hypothetical protein
MKKVLWPLMALLVLAGAGCFGASTEPQIGDAPIVDEYKKVSVTADVVLKRPGGTEATTCIGSGAFAFDFYFPTGGGEVPLVQNSFFQLTDYNCLFVGTPCSVEPQANAWVEREITADADLRINHGAYTSDAGESLKGDRIQFRLEQLPTRESFDVLWQCEGAPGIQPDPALLTQLYLPLYQEGWEFLIAEGDTYITTRIDYELNMGVVADITFAVSMERTDSAE